MYFQFMLKIDFEMIFDFVFVFVGYRGRVHPPSDDEGTEHDTLVVQTLA